MFSDEGIMPTKIKNHPNDYWDQVSDNSVQFHP